MLRYLPLIKKILLFLLRLPLLVLLRLQPLFLFTQTFKIIPHTYIVILFLSHLSQLILLIHILHCTYYLFPFDFSLLLWQFYVCQFIGPILRRNTWRRSCSGDATRSECHFMKCCWTYQTWNAYKKTNN
jgi:hypothetical protein